MSRLITIIKLLGGFLFIFNDLALNIDLRQFFIFKNGRGCCGSKEYYWC